MTAVSSDQRFTRRNPCPICGGNADLPQGSGIRCYGYRHGDYARCTREEYAGNLSQNEDGTYSHRLVGDCACGVRHDPQSAPLRPASKRDRGPVVNEERHEARDVDGELVAYHVRREYADGSKDFAWTQPDGTPGLNGRGSADMPLFGIHRVQAATWGVVVEGEKAQAALVSRRIPSVGTMTGARVIPSDDVLRSVLHWSKIILWPDADADGRQHMDRIAARLLDLGATDVRLVDWQDAPPKGDAADYTAANRNRGELKELLRAAAPWTPKIANDPEDCQTSALGNVGNLGERSIITRLSTVTREHVRWLWQRRIPLGKLTILDGDPDLFKTGMLLDLAARVTTGRPMPDGTQSDLDGPRAVMVLSAEDGLGDTIRPRLDAAGADVARVIALSIPDGEAPRLPVIPDDLDVIEEVAQAEGVSLLCFDPLVAFLSGTINAHRDQDVRRALARMAALAERTGAAIVVIRHLTKMAGGNPLYRGGGSIGIIGAARSGMIVARDPDDDTGERRILAMQKHNLSKPAPALAYHVETNPEGIPYVVWDGASGHTARTLLQEPDSDEERTALDDAKDVLRQILKNGPKDANMVKAETKEAGIADRTLYRAKAALRIASHKDGMHGGWKWELPKDANAAEDDQAHGIGNLRESWHPSALDTPQPSCPKCGYEYLHKRYDGALVCRRLTCAFVIEPDGSAA